MADEARRMRGRAGGCCDQAPEARTWLRSDWERTESGASLPSSKLFFVHRSEKIRTFAERARRQNAELELATRNGDELHKGMTIVSKDDDFLAV